MTLRLWLVLPLAVATLVWLGGCNSSTNTGTPTDGTAGEEHDHEEHDHEGHDHEGHDHEHDHAHHGPHGGHVMVVGAEEYHAEWTHDEAGKVTFYILDAAAKNEVPIAAEKVTVEVQVGENEPRTYELLAVNPQGDEMKTAQFEITDKEFEGALELAGKGTTATLIATIDGKEFRSEVKEHSHEH